MINTLQKALAEAEWAEPFEDRIDILYHELELATKWQCPSLLLAIYSSEYVHGDAEHALENKLISLGQRARHIIVKSQEDADIPMLISEWADLNDVVIFVEGLRWGCAEDGYAAYQALNKHREFFIENRVRVVFWLTESEAIHLAHHAPDYWTFRHRVIEFVDSPKPQQIQPQVVESAWQVLGDVSGTAEELDDKITLRTALLADLPEGEESTSARANLLLTLGILHWRRGDYDPAMQFLVTALDLAGKLGDDRFEALVHNAVALVETATGRYVQAIQAYRHAIALAPEGISPYNNLGNLYFKLEQYEDALGAYLKAVEQRPGDRINWVGLGDTQYKLGHHAKAAFAFKKALELTPEDAHCWKTLADVYADDGLFEEALAAYQKAIELDCTSAGAWIGMADVYRQQGAHEKALAAYQTAIEIDPDNADPWEGVGDVHFDRGSTGEAIQAYEKAIELDHAIGDSHSRLASLFFQQGNYAKAVPLLQKGIHFEQDPDLAAALWNQLGDTYRKLKDYEHAMEAYRQADLLAHGEQAKMPEVTPTDEAAPAPITDEINAGEAQTEAETTGEAEPVLELTEDLLTLPVNWQDETSAGETPAEAPVVEAAAVTEAAGLVNDSATMQDESDMDFARWLESLSTRLPLAEESPEALSAEVEPVAEVILNEKLPVEEAAAPETEPAASLEAAPATAEPETVETAPAPAASSKDQDLLAAIKAVVARLPKRKEPEIIEAAAEPTPEPAPMAEELPAASPLPEERAEVEAPVMETPLANISSGDANTARIWNELGNIYYNIVAYDEAINALKKALEIDRTYGWTYNNLASIYIHKGDFSEAIPLLQKGIPLMKEPSDKALLWNRLGDTYRHMDEKDKAAAAYQKAIELSPENVSLLTRARFSLLGNGAHD